MAATKSVPGNGSKLFRECDYVSVSITDEHNEYFSCNRAFRKNVAQIHEVRNFGSKTEKHVCAYVNFLADGTKQWHPTWMMKHITKRHACLALLTEK